MTNFKCLTVKKSTSSWINQVRPAMVTFGMSTLGSGGRREAHLFRSVLTWWVTCSRFYHMHQAVTSTGKDLCCCTLIEKGLSFFQILLGILICFLPPLGLVLHLALSPLNFHNIFVLLWKSSNCIIKYYVYSLFMHAMFRCVWIKAYLKWLLCFQVKTESYIWKGDLMFLPDLSCEILIRLLQQNPTILK